MRPAARNYLREMRGSRIGGGLRAAGRAFGAVGKTIASPGYTMRDKMIKEHGKWYSRPYGKGGATISGEKAKRMLAGMKYTDRNTKKAIEYMLGRRDTKKMWSPGKKGITAEDILKGAHPAFVKEFGEQGANELMRALTLEKGVEHSKYKGGKQIRIDEALKDLRRAKNIQKERMPIARQIVKGLMVPYEPPSRRGVTPEDVAEVAQETTEELGEKPAARFEDAYGVERVEQFGQQPKEQKHMVNSSRIEQLQQKRGTIVVTDGLRKAVGALGQKISSLNKK